MPTVKQNDLAEKISRKLSGIESVPQIEKQRMIQRAVKVAMDEVERLRAERDDADRRAGAAERMLEHCKDSGLSRKNWIREAKRRAGYDDSVSFDVVFNDLLSLKQRIVFLGGTDAAIDVKKAYTFQVKYSEEDENFVGTCCEFPSLSWLSSMPVTALSGIIKVVHDCALEMDEGELPAPKKTELSENYQPIW